MDKCIHRRYSSGGDMHLCGNPSRSATLRCEPYMSTPKDCPMRCKNCGNDSFTATVFGRFCALCGTNQSLKDDDKSKIMD